MSDNTYAVENAKAHLESIVELSTRLACLGDERQDEKTREDAQEEAQKYPLAVQVRTGWGNVGEARKDVEYYVLLSTGGPACRIIGDLDGYGQPETARLEWQDWGTPWTHLPISDDETKALLTFATSFYFGEG